MLSYLTQFPVVFCNNKPQKEREKGAGRECSSNILYEWQISRLFLRLPL